jgi:hypothetical protein
MTAIWLKTRWTTSAKTAVLDVFVDIIPADTRLSLLQNNKLKSGGN